MTVCCTLPTDGSFWARRPRGGEPLAPQRQHGRHRRHLWSARLGRGAILQRWLGPLDVLEVVRLAGGLVAALPRQRPEAAFGRRARRPGRVSRWVLSPM